jgi:hypothetical protein
MDSEITQWLDQASRGLPLEIQKKVRNELANHYIHRVNAYQRDDKTVEMAHRLAMVELGEASITAQSLRRSHLSLYRHLLAFTALVFVFSWSLIHGGHINPYPGSSGNVRIVISIGVFLLLQFGVFELKHLMTKQLQLSNLKLPINIQIIGLVLTQLLYFEQILRAKVVEINHFLWIDFPEWGNFFWTFTRFATGIASGLIGVGFILMAWRLVKESAHLYGLARSLQVISIPAGIIYLFDAITKIAEIFSINLSSVTTKGLPTQIGVFIGNGMPPDFILLSTGFDWLQWLGSFALLLLGILVLLVALIFLKAYHHSLYWLKQMY